MKRTKRTTPIKKTNNMEIRDVNLNPFWISVESEQMIVHETLNGEQGDTDKIIGYFLKWEYAIDTIIKKKMAKKNKVISLVEFIEEFKAERNILLELV